MYIIEPKIMVLCEAISAGALKSQVASINILKYCGIKVICVKCHVFFRCEDFWPLLTLMPLTSNQ